MIRQFFCLLLVLLMLANQGLGLAHTHRGSDVAEPKDHAARAHVHFGGHGHHHSTHNHNADHSHGDNPGRDQSCDQHDMSLLSALVPIGDHDADAVYFAEAIAIARHGNSRIVPSAKHVTLAAVLWFAKQRDVGLLRLGELRGSPPSVYATACPIYLRTLSLRI